METMDPSPSSSEYNGDGPKEIIINLDENSTSPNYEMLMFSALTSYFHPPTPVIQIQDQSTAFGLKLRDFAFQNQIVNIRGLDQVLGVDLSLFESENLMKIDPNFKIDVRLQVYQHGDSNFQNGKRCWEYYSFLKNGFTIKKYAEYQSEFDFSLMAKTPKIKFGTNIDLSDKIKWKAQLEEISKLPPFLQVDSSENLLNYVGYEVLGMNAVQLYMKVPGSRTPGHQENLNFCSVNINIGPGECEWFAVSAIHWEVIVALCEDNGLNFLKDSWWPDPQDLQRRGIPVFRFIQKPGDLVWVGIGCVHWVQAKGICNNIAWNVGPLTAAQYQAAFDRYEYNRTQSFQSLIPMVRLSWNFAKRINRTKNKELFDLVKSTLWESITQNSQTLETLRFKKASKLEQLGQPDDQDLFCSLCKVEVFNLSLVKLKSKSSKKRKDPYPNIYCLKCALEQNESLEGFQYIETNSEEELQKTYEEFLKAHEDPEIPVDELN